MEIYSYTFGGRESQNHLTGLRSDDAQLVSGSILPIPMLYPDSLNHSCEVPFVVFPNSSCYHMDIVLSHFLASHTWLAVLGTLDSATNDQFLLLSFFHFTKSSPAETLKIQFSVLVETAHIVSLGLFVTLYFLV